MFRPKTPITTQYNIFRQSPGAEQWGGVTLLLKPTARAANCIEESIPNNQPRWALPEIMRGIEQVLSEQAISETAVSIVALAEDHPIDSKPRDYHQAAKQALLNTIAYFDTAAPADSHLSLTHTVRFSNLRDCGVVAQLTDDTLGHFVSRVALADEAPFQLALEEMMAQESAEILPAHSVELKQLICRYAHWDIANQQLIPLSPSEPSTLPALIKNYRREFRAALHNVRKFA